MTFLFTDLEGSTSMWEHDPASMDVALRAHDDLVSSVIAGGRGHVFSRAGDSFAAAFSSAADAVASAVGVQRGLASLEGPINLRARVALHTGEAFEREGNYFGPAVNRAARLMATAHGGQVICSAATAALARPNMTGATLRPLGTFALRDLLAPELVFQVDAAGLDASFPPLRTLDAVRHNLPVQQTTLIGREAEVLGVIEALGQSRLVTLTGVGGCGKTRLALAVGAELAASAVDGVFLVPLVSATNGDGVFAAFLDSMKVRLAQEEPSSLARFLSDRDVVLIVDNCEHVLDEVCDLVDVLLSQTSALRVLATSREALGSAGEHVIRVPSLAADGRHLEENPAVALLLERAQHAGVMAERLTDAQDDLREICQRLDGIPLAIELAAVRLQQLSTTDLLERLDHRFDLLVGGHGRRRQRQQTLQAMMDWSWDLLTPDERELLAVLSVFSSPWSLEDAELVARPVIDGNEAVLVSVLVAKSLVDPIASSTRRRYRLLETVRLFAASKLVELGLADDARTAHARRYVDQARVFTPDRCFGDLDVVDLVADEMTETGTAIEWLTRRDSWDDAAEVVVLCGGCYSRGFSSRRGVAEVTELAPRVSDAVLKARMLIAGAYAAVCTGEHNLTQLWVAEARELADQRDAFAASHAAVLAAAPLILVDPDTASDLLIKSHVEASQGGTPFLAGSAQMWLNMAHLCSLELDVPVADDGDAADFGGRHSIGWAVARHVGALRLAEQGRREDALALLDPIDLLSAPIEDDDIIRLGIEALAGDPERVWAMAQDAIDYIDRRGDVLWHGELVVMLGIAHLRAHRLEDAVIHMEVAKRAPMVFPFWYALARRYGRQARSALDPAIASEAISRSKRLTVEELLDREVRGADQPAFVVGGQLSRTPH